MRSVAIALPILVAACSNARPTGAELPPTAARAEVQSAAETGSTSAGVAPTSHGPVVAQIQFRDHVLIIRPGTGELLFDMQTRAGVLLHRGLTQNELERLFPEVADQVRDSIALDASLHRDVDNSVGP